MSLFTPSLNYDSNAMEATVTNVDPIRFVCSVKTVRGQFLNEVPWLLPSGGSGKNSMHFAPTIGDQVVIYTGLTYPLIIGSLPRSSPPITSLTSISNSPLSIDAGNNTNLKNGYVGNPGKPSDFVAGDIVFSTEGGSILGALLNGSIIAKVSSLAQIFLSKYDDLVRVVARNWERFSDVGQQTVANAKGRLYEYLGWDRSLARSKVALYELQEVIGDVAAGEVLLGDPNSTAVVPAADTRVRKYWLTDATGHSVMVEILYQDGKLDLLVQDTTGTNQTREVQINNKYEVTSTDGSNLSRVTIVPSSITIDSNSGASTVTVTPTAITSVHGQASHVIDSTGVKSSFGIHFFNVTSTGVQIG